MSALATSKNPFPGLRPFRSEEDYLFFGREEQVTELLKRLSRHRLVAVVGASGSGKSSLVRCGLLSELQGGRLVEAGSDWRIAIMQPGGDPIPQLARAIHEAGIYQEEDEETLPRIEATLRRSGSGLIEAVRQSDLDPASNFLLVVDQFEEIFRFHRTGVEGREDAPDFIRLLLEAVSGRTRAIYVVLTMRSDFLGDCSRFTGLAEAVNDGEYLIPKLTRDQSQAAIEGPIRVAGGKISRRLVQRLLNDLEEDTDQLPVLQHCLMRMWARWQSDHGPDEPLDLRHYQAIGGMAEALLRHADEVLRSLPSQDLVPVAEKIFRALTEKGVDGRGVRRPKRLGELAAITGAAPEIVAAVIEAYRKPGVTFLMPPVDFALRTETVVDISHESLMRVWDRLRRWVEEEAQSARVYRRLAETAALWKEGKAGLYHDPDLQIALAWREQALPNDAWANQYGGRLEEAMAFLDQSRDAAQAEARAREEARQRELDQAKALAEAERQRLEVQQRATQRLRVFLVGLAVVALIAVGALVMAVQARKEAVANASLAARKEQEARLAAAQLRETLVENDFNLAGERLATGAAGEGLAYLARAMRNDSGYWRAGVRSLSTLASGLFPGQQFERLRQSNVITTVIHNPKENLILTSDAGAMKDELPERIVWDMLTGQPLYHVAAGPKGAVVKWTEDGKYLCGALTNENQLRLWEARTGRLVASVNPAPLRVVDFSLRLDPVDGWTALLKGASEEVRLFSALSGQPLTPSLQAGPNSEARQFGFVPGAGRIYMERRSGVTFWNLRGDLLWDLEIDGWPVAEILHGPGGRTLVARSQDQLNFRWWNLGQTDGMPTSQSGWLKVDDKITAVRFVDQAPRLALFLAGDPSSESGPAARRMLLYDLESRAELKNVDLGHSRRLGWTDRDPATGLDSFPLVAAWEENRLRIWDYSTGDLLSEIKADGLLTVAMFSPDGTMISTLSEKGGVMVWDIVTGRPLFGEPLRLEQLNNWTFSPDGGKLVTVDAGRRLTEIWNARTGQRLREPLGEKMVSDFYFSSAGDRLLLYLTMTTTAGSSFSKQTVGELRLVDLKIRPAIPQRLVDDSADWEDGAAWFTPDGRHLITHGRPKAGEPCQIQIWDPQQRQLLRSIPLPEAEQVAGADANCLSLDGKQLALGFSGKWARLIDVETGRITHQLAHSNTVNLSTVAWTTDGRRLATATTKGLVSLWDAQSGTLLVGLTNHGDMRIETLAFSPDGTRLVSGSRDQKVRVANLESGQLLSAPIELPGLVLDLRFSADGRRLVLVPFANEIFVVEPDTGRIIRRLAHTDACRVAIFSPDGRTLAVGTGGGLTQPVGDIYLWDWESGEQAIPPINARGPVAYLAFSPDGRMLVSGTIQTGNGQAQVWDVQTGLPLTDPFIEAQEVRMLAVHPGGELVAIGWGNGAVDLVDLPPTTAPLPEWLPILAEQVGRKSLPQGKAAFVEVSATAEWDRLRSALNTSESQAAYPRWGRWLTGHGPDHPISPGTTQTYQGYLSGLRLKGSRTAQRKLLQIEPGDAVASGRLGLLELQAYKRDTNLTEVARHQAMRSARWRGQKSVDLAPENPDVWLTYAELLGEAGQATAAGQATLKALELDPTQAGSQDPNGSYLRALSLARNGQWSEADAAFAQAVGRVATNQNPGLRIPFVGSLGLFQPFLTPAGSFDLTLPDPIPGTFEDFESVREGAIPEGWTGNHHTTPDRRGNGMADLDQFRSDAYLNWCVLADSRVYDGMKDIALTRWLTSGDPYVRINGQAPYPLMQGRFAYARSAGRQGDQIQCLETRDFNCAGRSNICAVLRSVFEQQRNNLAAVEYSIDQGKTWHPALYRLDDLDVVRGADGAIDAAGTMTRRHSDLPWWRTGSGELAGGAYGAFIRAEINRDLAPFISGAADDRPSGLHHVERLRLAQADGEPHVRLRFVHVGSSSSSWGLDDFGLYELPQGITPPAGSDHPTYASIASDPTSLAVAAARLLQERSLSPGPMQLRLPEDFTRFDPPPAPTTNSVAPSREPNRLEIEARLILRRALTLDPGRPWIQFLHALAAARCGDLDAGWTQANEAYGRLSESSLFVPGLVSIYALRGDAFFQAGDLAGANLCYEAAERLTAFLLHTNDSRITARFNLTGLSKDNPILLPRKSVWRFFDRTSDPGANWAAPEFDDSAWQRGAAPLGYGDNQPTRIAGGTSSSRRPTAYFRTTFTAEHSAEFSLLRFRVLRDDGVVVYLTGKEVLRDNMPPGTISQGTLATQTVGGTDESSYFEFRVPNTLLRPGTNTLAAEVHQADRTSSDLSFDLELEGGGVPRQGKSAADLAALEDRVQLPSAVRELLWLDRVRRHQLAGDTPRVQEAFQVLRQLAGNSPAALAEEAWWFHEQGKEDQAYRKFVDAIEAAGSLQTRPPSVETLLLPEALHRVASFTSIRADFLAVISGSARDRSPRTSLHQDWLWRRSLELDSLDPEASLRRVESLLRRAEPDAALSEINRALQDGPPAPDASPCQVRQYHQWLTLKVDTLNRLQRDDEAEEVLRLLAKAPPRKPGLDDRLIDLSSHYNSSLYDGRAWSSGQEWNLASLPETWVPLSGVDFDLRGIVQLDSGIIRGESATREQEGKTYSQFAGRPFPEAVRDIQIRQKAHRLHWLINCRGGNPARGTVVARFVIHYEGDEKVEVPLKYGEDIADWTLAPGASVERSNVAWRFPHPDYTSDQHFLLQGAWLNPDPEKLVSHIDFISEQTIAAPFLVALTAD